MSKRHGRFFIGTSGWSYDHWEGPFYPDGLSADERLEYYAARFNSVEINRSFYSLPDEQTLRSWRTQVPAGFRFAAKASRYITHMKKLKDPQEGVVRLLSRMRVLGSALGPVLFQLPPRWRFNADRLESFLECLADDLRYSFEFRDHSWLNKASYSLLARHRAAFCIYDLDGFVSPREVTTDFVYVRLHGPDGPYQGCYDRQALSGWAGALSTWSRQGLDVYCYFDNDQHGYAAHNAATLRDMLDS
ncbi:DUF72 domain-containing protein [Thioalkalivibrio sp.]|uniref:DUF72 domain-containing protein n=1 Tax=Thioalkalivibrio sp. TaxID=2093813 RepID=UPI0012D52EFE|nr:DUF72 domain-containing protein [Thioalkalivibrio sp.]TVP82690.1 MAG: DUF72 domain-containing protein [Thioalkalivibrio sp.]